MSPLNLRRKATRSTRVETPLKRMYYIRHKAHGTRKLPAYKSGLKPGSKFLEGNTVSIVCRLEAFREEQARCWAEISGAKVPIDLPSAVLKESGVLENTAFIWTFSDMLPISRGRATLLEEPVPAMHPDQERELDILLQEALKSREQGRWAFLDEQ